MAKQYSTGMRDSLAVNGPLKQVMDGAKMLVYSTSQAADADTGVSTSNIIATLTANGVAGTSETRAEWKNTIGGSATGALNGLFLGHEVVTGTAASGSTTTIALTGASASDDIYNGMFVYGVSGTGKGNIAQITDYVGSTKVATVSALNGTTFTSPGADTAYSVICGVEILGTPVSYTTDAATTADLVVAQINHTTSIPDLIAYAVSAGEYRIKAPNGVGTAFNGLRIYSCVAGSLTNTIASLEVNVGVFVKGVKQIGGITWSGTAAAGQIPLVGTWSTGTGTTYGAAGSSCKAGTMTSYRIVVDPADDGSSTSTTYPRIDGNIGTLSTNDLQVSSTVRANGDPMTIGTYPLGFKATTTA